MKQTNYFCLIFTSKCQYAKFANHWNVCVANLRSARADAALPLQYNITDDAHKRTHN
jgi:hypothetical protein